MIRRAIRQNGQGRVSCIDPFAASGLPDWFPEATVRREPVQAVPPSVFEALRAGDILFIDSSHVAQIGSDVTYLFLEIIPRLHPGVVVHIHDIFLPMEMRKEWVLDEMRFWTEQYLLQAFLAFNREFEVLMANSYLGLYHVDVLRATFPRSPWWGGGSFWMRRMVRPAADASTPSLIATRRRTMTTRRTITIASSLAQTGPGVTPGLSQASSASKLNWDLLFPGSAQPASPSLAARTHPEPRGTSVTSST